MGYYTRILSPSSRAVSVDELRIVLKQESLNAILQIEDGTEADWTSLVLKHESGPEIAVIERNPVGPETLGSAEIDEFLEEIGECQPASAVRWISEYLPTVKVIFAFQWLSGTNAKSGGDIVGSLMIGLQKLVGGVIQADGEGFSDDEQGDHILWQFSDRVKGPWRMAVRQDGKWVRFEMELGDRKHREAFLRGEIPSGVRIIEE
jgi:hypothetical protein